jgi:two-component system sensor histidine kinase ChvG
MTDGGGARRRRRTRLGVSRLTFTIALANLIGLVILLLGSLGLNQFRDGLIDAKLEGVRAQAQIIADVLAQVAIPVEDCGPPETTLGDAGAVAPNGPCALALNENNVSETFNRVWDSFEGRVRIFRAPRAYGDPPVADAAPLLIEDVVLRRDVFVVDPLPPIVTSNLSSAARSFWETAVDVVGAALSSSYRHEAARRTIEQEINAAIAATPEGDNRGAASVRMNENGELVASVTVPIRRVQAIYGFVTAEIGGIDAVVREARLAILPFFGLACLAALLTSLLLTTTIAQPLRQLSNATDKVREGISAAGRARIPDFSNRKDEVGELSEALRLMTQTIYARMEAIESFAADVAHELKNPLTSIRSAVETLDIARAPEAREKLMGVIKKDVARMDRLITDISNASRLDAELARQTREPVDIRKLLADIVDLYAATQKEGEAAVSFDQTGEPLYLTATPATLSQVFRNLIDNARSFSPASGAVRVFVDPPGPRGEWVRVRVEDDGPGVPPEALEKVFQRFYTKRPAGTSFGNNSGLGLAICRQIVSSHGGRIWAENRLADPADPGGARLGARFIVELPAP